MADLDVDLLWVPVGEWRAWQAIRGWLAKARPDLVEGQQWRLV
jgi:hypothetical protein